MREANDTHSLPPEWIVLLDQLSLLQQASIPTFKLLAAIIVPVLSFALWPLINFLIIALLLAIYSDIDLVRLALTTLGLLLINWTLSLIIVAVCSQAKKILPAIIQSVLFIVVLIIIEVSLSYIKSNVFESFASIIATESAATSTVAAVSSLRSKSNTIVESPA